MPEDVAVCTALDVHPAAGDSREERFPVNRLAFLFCHYILYPLLRVGRPQHCLFPTRFQPQAGAIPFRLSRYFPGDPLPRDLHPHVDYSPAVCRQIPKSGLWSLRSRENDLCHAPPALLVAWDGRPDGASDYSREILVVPYRTDLSNFDHIGEQK